MVVIFRADVSSSPGKKWDKYYLYCIFNETGYPLHCQLHNKAFI